MVTVCFVVAEVSCAASCIPSLKPFSTSGTPAAATGCSFSSSISGSSVNSSFFSDSPDAPPSENSVMPLPHAMDGVMEKHIVSASIPDNNLFFIEIPPSDPDLANMYICCFRILLTAMSFHSPVRFLLPVIITDFFSFDKALFGTKKCPLYNQNFFRSLILNQVKRIFAIEAGDLPDSVKVFPQSMIITPDISKLSVSFADSSFASLSVLW